MIIYSFFFQNKLNEVCSHVSLSRRLDRDGEEDDLSGTSVLDLSCGSRLFKLRQVEPNRSKIFSIVV